MVGSFDTPPSFPTPFPDEILFSVISRYNCLSGNRSDPETLRQLFCTRLPVTFTCLPNRLQTLFGRLPPDWITSTSELIEKLTIFPYYQPFLSENQVSNTIDQMLSSNGQGIKMGMGLSASRMGAVDIPRYCPECAVCDYSNYGIAYWHRAHLLPGVFVCFQHEEVLKEIKFSPEHPHRHNLFLPDFVDSEHISNVHMGLSTEQRKVLLSIAKNSHQLMMLNQNHLPRDLVHIAYKERLDEIGLLSAHGSVRQRELHKFLTSFYAEISELIPFNRLFPTESSDHSWITSMFRKPRRSMHPLKHLLIISAIYDSLPDFFKSVGSGNPPAEASPYYADKRLFDIDNLKSLIINEKLSLRQASNILGISVTTLSIEANKYEIKLQRKRPKRYSMKTERDAIKLLKKGEALPEISRQIDASVQYLNRLLRSNPRISYLRKISLFRAERRGRRQMLLNFLATEPSLSRTQVRQSMPRIWTWLYRHDPAWMHTVLPLPIQRKPIRHSRIDWELRDRAAAATVKKCAEILLKESAKPVRVSRTTLARSTGIQTLLKMCPEMLPETAKHLDQYAETIETFQVRRVHFAARELRKNSSTALSWQVMKAAGLNKNISHQVQQAIQEVAGIFPFQDQKLKNINQDAE